MTWDFSKRIRQLARGITRGMARELARIGALGGVALALLIGSGGGAAAEVAGSGANSVSTTVNQPAHAQAESSVGGESIAAQDGENDEDGAVDEENENSDENEEPGGGVEGAEERRLFLMTAGFFVVALAVAVVAILFRGNRVDRGPEED